MKQTFEKRVNDHPCNRKGCAKNTFRSKGVLKFRGKF